MSATVLLTAVDDQMVAELLVAVTDEQLKGIWERYQQRMAGPSGQATKDALSAGPVTTTIPADEILAEPEEKRWGWTYSGNVWEVKEEEPKRKLTFREWLDGGMKGECQWPRKTTTP